MEHIVVVVWGSSESNHLELIPRKFGTKKTSTHALKVLNWIHDTSPRRAKNLMEENGPIKSTLENLLSTSSNELFNYCSDLHVVRAFYVYEINFVYV